MTDPTECRFFGFVRANGHIRAMRVWPPHTTPEAYAALDGIVAVSDEYQAQDQWHAEREATRRLYHIAQEFQHD